MQHNEPNPNETPAPALGKDRKGAWIPTDAVFLASPHARGANMGWMWLNPTNLDGEPSRAVPRLISRGFRLARPGKYVRREHRCPVNGDGYYFHVRQIVLTDDPSTVVGYFFPADGDSGPL